MATKENTLRNQLKEADKPTKKPKSSSSSNKKSKEPFLPKDRIQQARKISALLMVSFSIYLVLSQISFLFSWQVDQSLVNQLDWETVKAANPEMTDNWMGIFGAWLSHLTIYKWFGLAGFLVPVVLFLSGIRLLYNAKQIPLGRIYSLGILAIMFFSILLGFIADKISGLFGTNIDFMGGGMGYELQVWMSGLVGGIGVLLVLGLVLMSFLVVMFNISFSLPKFGMKKKEEPMIYTSFEDGTMADAIANKLDGSGSGDIDEEEDDEDLDLDGIQLIVRAEDEAENDEDDDRPLAVKPPVMPAPPVTPPAPPVVPKPASTGGVSFEVKAPAPTPQPAMAAAPAVASIKADVEDAETENRGSWYKYPDINLLRNHESGNVKVDIHELEERKNLIVETLENYKIKIDKIEATIGPTVTLYEIIPAAGIRISKIKSLEDDIALSLAALGIRIIAPIPGKGTIGIEVPNQNPQVVSLKEALASPSFRNTTYDLPIALGKTISNEVFVADLTKMPHLLMAGATGQGKSVGINTIIASILYNKHPEDVKFVLVDPKKVELSLFKNIEKHFLPELPDGQEAIITDTKMVVDVLKSLCVEMDDRYDKLKDAQVRNIKEYNKKIERGLLDMKVHKRLPYIVLVIDELADLMMTAGKEVELPIARLAQLARAIGIHLIVATQRPSVNIITGIIKANFPARIAFRVTSRIDSRTILDTGGAEQLIGRGDMLYSTGNDIIRLQCPFIDTDEVDTVTKYIMEQPYPEPFRLNIYSEDGESGDIDFGDDLDPMFEDAARLIVSTQQGSTSMLQRRLKLGYNRAGRLMDQLEKMKIVGPNEGSKAREVLFGDEFALEQFLTDLASKYNR